MRILFFPFGSHGDVLPLVEIGSALQSRGHQVLLAANPRFEGMAKAAGLDMEPLGTIEEYAAVLDNPDVWHPSNGPRLLHAYTFGPELQRQIETVARHRNDDTVVVAGTFAVGAWLAAEQHHLPCVKIQGQPATFFGIHDPPVLPNGKKMGGPLWWRRALLGLFDKTVFRPVGKDLNRARRTLGLPLWPSQFMRSYVTADVNLCLFPDWFAAPTPDWPETARQVGFFVDTAEQEQPLSDGLATFLDDGSPPVVLTPGPAGYQHGDQFFRVALAACEQLKQRAVFVTRGQQLELDIPSSIHIAEYAPFGWLFARASLVVHHGGIGTVAQGLAAGCPQLITPFGFDQPDNAWRLRQLGVGETLMARTLTGAKLAAKIRVVLDSPTMVERAAQLKKRMAAPNPPPLELACQLIEALPAQHR